MSPKLNLFLLNAALRAPQLRHLSLGHNLKAAPKSHYDVLGLDAKATQAEVKAAYYNLSKVYHPDKNPDGSNEAATKFRDINAAYEILGNVKSRRLYDKGVSFGQSTEPGFASPEHEDDPKTRFYRSRERRHRPPPPPGGRATVYDFDEWSRAHYGATFARDAARKQRNRRMEEMRVTAENEVRVERVVFAVVIFTGLIMLLAGENYDVDRTAPGAKAKVER